MNWLTDFVKPKLSSLVGKKETPSDLWTTCSKCNLMLYKSDLEKNLYVCSHCDQHMYVDFDSRFRQLFDEQKYDLIEIPIENTDPLEFKDLKKYTDRLKEAQKKTNQNISSNLNIKSIIFIGLFQILALIPGVSRAGITLTAARYLKFNRVDSSKISFLLSIPALSGASFLGLKDIINQPVELNYLVFVAIISSFVLSFMTVKFFLIYINKFSMNAFVIYRIIIALILFSLIY